MSPDGAPGPETMAQEPLGEGSEPPNPMDEIFGPRRRPDSVLHTFSLPFEPDDDPRIDTLWRSIEDLELVGAGGEREWLFQGRPEGPLVVAFTQVDCPVAKRYGPTWGELYREFGARGVTFVGVDASMHDTFEEVEAQRRDLRIPFPYLRDPDQVLLKGLDVETSTEVLVFDEERRLAYRGAVDDRLAVGVVREKGRRDFVRDALEALLSGAAPPVQYTRAPGCVVTRLRDEPLPVPDPVTYYEHVEPILQARCTSCHRDGQAAPFALEDYEDAKGWSGMIAFVVREGIMPPWPVSDRFRGEFHEERALEPLERATLIAWSRSGAPAGDPGPARPEPEREEGWTLEDLDLVLEADSELEFTKERLIRTPLPEKGFHVKANEELDYKTFTAPYLFEEDTWVSGIEVRPTALAVVHHIGVFLATPHWAQKEKKQRGEKRLRLGPGYLGVYTPGSRAVEWPTGYAKRIPANTILYFQVHYTPDGMEHYDRPKVALRFAREVPRFEVATGAVTNTEFAIPAGSEHFRLRAAMRLPADITLLGLMPHMHYRGKHFRFMARDREGRVRSLVSLPWEFDWQMAYQLREPLPLAAGSWLLCTGVMDNSADNLFNPDPSVEVRHGWQSWDEMFLGYFDFAVPVKEARFDPGQRPTRIDPGRIDPDRVDPRRVGSASKGPRVKEDSGRDS